MSVHAESQLTAPPPPQGPRDPEVDDGDKHEKKSKAPFDPDKLKELKEVEGDGLESASSLPMQNGIDVDVKEPFRCPVKPPPLTLTLLRNPQRCVCGG